MGTDSEISSLKERLAALDRERANVARGFRQGRLASQCHGLSRRQLKRRSIFIRRLRSQHEVERD